MVLLGELYSHAPVRNKALKAGTLYRRELNNSKYVPNYYRVVYLGAISSFSHRIDIYTRDNAPIYFMLLKNKRLSTKGAEKKAETLLAMLKAAQ